MADGSVKEKLDSWRGFQHWIDDHSDSRWVFRGSGDISFTLTPSIGRVRDYSLAREKQVLASFQRRMPQHVDNSPLTEWEKMAVAQHHGVPTRMLDWSTNPLVAAHFAAASSAGACEVQLAGYAVQAIPDRRHVDCRIVAVRVRSNQVIDLKAKIDPFSLDRIAFALPATVAARIGSQAGLFSVHPEPAEAWKEPLDNASHNFIIPGRHRDFFLRRLFYLGIDPLYLMGGLDGLGARAAWQAQRNIGLGAIV